MAKDRQTMFDRKTKMKNIDRPTDPETMWLYNRCLPGCPAGSDRNDR